MSRIWLFTVLVLSACNDVNPLYTTSDAPTAAPGSTSDASTTGGGPGTSSSDTSSGAPSTCGDGVVDDGEACDDGPDNADEADCKLDCSLQICGDGFVGPGEACDDGPNNADAAGCTLGCTVQACGDGFVGPGEGCDDGNANADDAICKLGCIVQACGDGDLGPGEGCDDGNAMDGDGCTAVCVLESCGDGVVQIDEACDDGDADPDDGCTPLCTLPTCGDAFVQASLGEQCDDGQANADNAACTHACKAALCGDYLLHAGVEACDDGAFNGLLGACSATCDAAACGDGTLQQAEGCDDGDTNDGDGCAADCTPELQLTLGDAHTCALVGGDELRCWGRGTYGQLGYGNTTHRGDSPGELPTPLVNLGQHTVVAMASVQNANCVVLEDGTVRCWGGNNYGELGINTAAEVGDNAGEMPPAASKIGALATAIVGENLSFCVRTTDDELRCMGNNTYGNLGIGSTNNLGDDPGELPASSAPVGLVPELMAAGANHFCVASAAGVVRCWGRGASGQLGYGDTTNRGDQPGELPTPDVDLGGIPAQLVAGTAHTCALCIDGGVRCWGSNTFGQLGRGDTASLGDQPGEMPPAEIDLGGPAVRLASAGHSVCALMADRQVRCWGRNNSGQLGIGGVESIGDQPGEMPPAVTPLGGDALAIFTGVEHVCALLDGGAVRCWGRNNYGQLGIGSTQNLGDDEAVLSKPAVPVE